MQELLTIWREVRTWPADQRLKLAQRLLASVQAELRPGLHASLAAMAGDPQIQRELAAIGRDFAATEMDGLEPE